MKGIYNKLRQALPLMMKTQMLSPKNGNKAKMFTTTFPIQAE